VENISSPRRRVLYLLNNFNILNIQNDDVCHLPPQDHEQLVGFFNSLKGRNVSETQTKKRIRVVKKVRFLNMQPFECDAYDKLAKVNGCALPGIDVVFADEF